MNNYCGVQLSQFYNKNTLNIFSDASIHGKKGNQTGCYAVVAVVKDDIIDSTYRLVSNTTSNNSEIKGVRGALNIALKYSNQFQFINIFSDSLVSINGLKSYIYNWKYNKLDNLLSVLEQSPCIINLWHQSGHINNDYSDIQKASESFKKNNNINGKIDFNFIRYISLWNNYVDQTSRSLLKRNGKNNNNIADRYLLILRFF